MNEIEKPYVMKKNFTTFGRDVDSKPVVKVHQLVPLYGKKGGPNGKVLINGSFQVDKNDIIHITEESAIKIIEVWESSGILSPVVNSNVNTKCVREDNGKPKATYPGTLGFQRPLFTFRMKNPDGGFQAYTCPECGKVHIGKTTDPVDLGNEKIHINTRLRLFSTSELMNAVEDQEIWRQVGNTEGYPWERFNNATKVIYTDYMEPLNGEGFSSWSASYNSVCHELAKRVIGSRRNIEHLL